MKSKECQFDSFIMTLLHFLFTLEEFLFDANGELLEGKRIRLIRLIEKLCV